MIYEIIAARYLTNFMMFWDATHIGMTMILASEFITMLFVTAKRRNNNPSDAVRMENT